MAKDKVGKVVWENSTVVRVPFHRAGGSHWIAYLYDTVGGQWIKRVGGICSGPGTERICISAADVPAHVRSLVEVFLGRIAAKKNAAATRKANRKTIAAALKPLPSEQKIQHAQEQLKRWMKKQKLANTKVSQWTRRMIAAMKRNTPNPKATTRKFAHE